MGTGTSVKAALVDFDGTLVHLPVDWETLRKQITALLKQHGVNVDGVRLYGLLAEGMGRLEAAGISAEQRQQIRAQGMRILDDAEIEAAPAATELPGAAEFLRRLELSGWTTVIQTSNSVRCVQSVLDRLGLPNPAAIAGRESAPDPKPDPQGVLAALSSLGISPQDCVVVGDGDFDVQVAREIGATVIRIGSGGQDRRQEPRADHDVTSLAEAASIMGLAPALERASP
jgi:phosphoglycolate phosphatase